MSEQIEDKKHSIGAEEAQEEVPLAKKAKVHAETAAVEATQESKAAEENKPTEQEKEVEKTSVGSKFDPKILPESNDPSEILKQVEFYFSDQNLPNDKFLWKVTHQSEGGWVPIKTIRGFKRMVRFNKCSEKEVADALRQSAELLEVSEDDANVRRKKDIVEPAKEERQNRFSRTVYAKGFEEETPTTQVDVEQFFEQYGEVTQVRLRRNDKKQFKGSVFAEFANLEDAQKFLALEPTPKFGDNELVTMSKQAYVDMKNAEHGFAANANGKYPKKFNGFREKRRVK